MTKVSVIMPVYNCEDYLKDSVESILNQTLSDLELLCVDDGSTDNSLNILKEYEKADSRVKVYNQDHAGGGNARNFAMNYISGEYLYFMDADDTIALNAFEDFYSISKSKKLDFLMFKAKNFDVDNNVAYERDFYNMPSISNGVGDNVFNFSDVTNHIFDINVTPWSKFYNTEFIIRSKAQFKNNSKFNDNQFFWDIIFQAERIYFLDDFYYTHSVRSDSLIGSCDKNHCDSIDVNNDVIDLFKKHGQFENFKETLYNRKIHLFMRRYDEIVDEYKELFFFKMKQDFKRNINSDFRTFLADFMKFIYDSVLISKNHDEFDRLKEYYAIIRSNDFSFADKMESVKTWFEGLDKNQKMFAFLFIKNDLTEEYMEFFKKFFFKVSVVLPVYNVEGYLEDAFNSILNQSIGFENLQVIFVDDASTDSSPQIIKKYSDEYENVISIFLDKNSGYAGLPRNVGMKYANADYLMFLDPDDVFTENACEILYNQITSDNLDIVCGVHSDGEKVPEWIWKNLLTDCQEPWDERVKKCQEMLKNSNFELKINSIDEYPSVISAANVWNKIFKKSLIENNNITFPPSIPAEDSVFLINAFLNASGIKFINEIIVIHKYGRSGSSQNQFSKDKIIKRINAYYMMFYACMEKNKTEIFKHHLLADKLRHVLLGHIMKSDLSTGDILEILSYAKPLFKLYIDYGGIIPENLVVFRDIACGNFENALIFIHNENTPNQKNIKVATILDSFSYNSFKYEFDLIDLTPDNWLNQFKNEKPDLFFCESAYNGKITEEYPWGIWAGKIGSKLDNEVSPILCDILKYCRKNCIPTVFWNKEDPIAQNDSTIDFITIGLKFDYIFTSCVESVENYKIMGHEHAYPLMFAAQPKLFNPIKRNRLSDTVIFAGSWYSKFPKRCKTMEEIFDKILNNNLNLKIYDRFFKASKQSMKFPEKYRKYVNDGVDYKEIPDIYKESEFCLNFNTVTDSNTMFARRVFELMASDSIVLSNYSKGIYRLFGDNVIYLDKTDLDLNRNFDKIKEENLYNVLENHTYSKRFTQILDTINFKYIPDLKHIVLFYRLDDLGDLTKIQNHFYSIDYPYKHLKLITDEDNLFLSDTILESDLESVRLDENYYFSFTDLNLNADFVKKALLHFQYIDNNVGIKNGENKYCFDQISDIHNTVFNSYKFLQLISKKEDFDVYYI